jgi:hypothetical protein
MVERSFVMEENTEQITNEEEKFEIKILQTNEETGEVEITMHDRNLVFHPTEYELKNYRNSWKKCHCGRQTWFNDNWCPACGQKLGFPNIEE